MAKAFSDTSVVRALDPEGGLRFHQRFQVRLLGYMLLLSLSSSVLAGAIYHNRQAEYVEAEQTRRGRTLVRSVAGLSAPGTARGEQELLRAAVGRVFHESDVSHVVIYDRYGRPLQRLLKAGATAPSPLTPQLLSRILALPEHETLRESHPDRDELFCPILLGARTTASGPAAALGVAGLGLSRLPAQQKLDEVDRWSVIVGLLVLTMGVVIALVLSHRLARPIMALARGADAVRRGDLGYQLTLNRGDELGLLAQSFNRMSTQLKQTVDSLAHLNRNLEQEVVTRTADLQRSRDFVSMLNAPPELDRLLDRALRALMRHVPGSAGALYLLRSSGELELMVSQGAHAGAFVDPEHPQEQPRVLAEAVEQGKSCLSVSLPQSHPLRADCPEAKMMFCTPVTFQDTTEAALLLCLDAPPDPSLVEFVTHASSELGIAVANARAFAAAERLTKELERRNDALLQQRDQLLEVSRLKSEFLANVSHELRTPLNAVIGYSELLREGIYGEVSQPQRESLLGIEESAGNLLKMINGLLDLSRVESGRIKVTLREVDLNQLVREVKEQMLPLFKERPYQLETRLPPEVTRVRTDPTMVRQILTNLVSNAVKFTKQGFVRLLLFEDEEQQIALAVEDSGPGIRTEHMELIFDAFRQVDGSSTREHGGTGLGLAISKKFARLLGGDIEVSSVWGEGSRFTLLLKQAKIASGSDARQLPEVPVTIGESNV